MPNELDPTRRRLLAAGALAATGWVLDDAAAQQIAPTPACHDGDEPTLRQTDGPYFKPSSPERADLVVPGAEGRPCGLSWVENTRPRGHRRGGTQVSWVAGRCGA